LVRAIREFDSSLKQISRNVERFFGDYKFSQIDFGFVQGRLLQSSSILLSNPLLPNGGLSISADFGSRVLFLRGDDSPYGEWPFEDMNGSPVWITDAVSRSAGDQVELLLREEDDLNETILKRVAATTVFVLVADMILLDIHAGVWDFRFGEHAQTMKFPEFLPFRAEQFWRLESLGVVDSMRDWGLDNWWAETEVKFEASGFKKGYVAGPFDVGRVAGGEMARKLADEIIRRRKLR